MSTADRSRDFVLRHKPPLLHLCHSLKNRSNHVDVTLSWALTIIWQRQLELHEKEEEEEEIDGEGKSLSRTLMFRWTSVSMHRSMLRLNRGWNR
jgi:hypothetical protein